MAIGANTGLDQARGLSGGLWAMVIAALTAVSIGLLGDTQFARNAGLTAAATFAALALMLVGLRL